MEVKKRFLIRIREIAIVVVAPPSLHPMLTNSEEHREVFPEPPLIAFRRRKNLKDILVRARLSSEGNGGNDKKGCSRCGKSCCQVCNVMSNSEHFHSTIDSQEYI